MSVYKGERFIYPMSSPAIRASGIYMMMTKPFRRIFQCEAQDDHVRWHQRAAALFAM